MHAASNGPKALQLLFHHCIRPFNLTDRMQVLAINSGIPTLEILFEDWASDVETSPALIKQAAIAGKETLKHLLDNSRSKPQITYDILDLRGLPRPCQRMLLEFRVSERNLTEEEAIAAIQSGPEAFLELLNRRGTNFRLNEKICEIAVQHDYAVSHLREKRRNEWFIFCPKQAPKGFFDTTMEFNVFTNWENTLLAGRSIEQAQ